MRSKIEGSLNNCGTTWEHRSEDTDTANCSYCGSLTPADFIKFMSQSGTSFSGSDWKYGYPHKFYVEPVNPKADELVEMGSGSGDGTDPLDYWSCFNHPVYMNASNKTKNCSCPIEKATGYWKRPIMGKRARLFFKFYTNHIKDATPEEFEEIRKISTKFFGIDWQINGDKLQYTAPRTNSFYGYQRAGEVKEDGEPNHSL